jgi:poly-gamma-glutamate capsule biosynthesis protein CapA/YwtB (metallophosphatase superfamily)
VVVAQVSNNHALDLGARGQKATRAALLDAGITAAGAAPGQPMAVVLRNQKAVAVVAYDLSTLLANAAAGSINPGGTNGDSRAAVSREVTAAVARAERRVDVVVVMFHVTGPPSYVPAPELVWAVDAAVAAGAQIVAAHGTHAPARVERRGPAVIAWGLGNLVFSCPCTDERDGLVLRATVADGRVTSAAVIPVDAGLQGEPARLSRDPELMFDLLQALGSSPLSRAGDRAYF